MSSKSRSVIDPINKKNFDDPKKKVGQKLSTKKFGIKKTPTN